MTQYTVHTPMGDYVTQCDVLETYEDKALIRYFDPRVEEYHKELVNKEELLSKDG